VATSGATSFSVHPEGARVPAEVERLAEQVEADGGTVLAAYREPVGGHWQLFALLPRPRVAPTPYQRDLSKAHAERLHRAIKKLDRFVDPVVAVRGGEGYWVPNGNHRRWALDKLKADFVPAILVPEPEVAFQILALNTEKAHNLKEKSLEVIRMYRGLMEEGDRRHEDSFAFQFEEPHFITLGLLYEKNARFAGGAPSVPTGQGSLGSGRLLVHLDRERRVVAVERRLRDDATARDADRELSPLSNHRERQPAVALDERFHVARRHVRDLAQGVADLVVRRRALLDVEHRRRDFARQALGATDQDRAVPPAGDLDGCRQVPGPVHLGRRAPRLDREPEHRRPDVAHDLTEILRTEFHDRPPYPCPVRTGDRCSLRYHPVAATASRRKAPSMCKVVSDDPRSRYPCGASTSRTRASNSRLVAMSK